MDLQTPVRLVFLIYVIIGIVVAWEKHYITVGLLKGVLSALLAIFLWWLPAARSQPAYSLNQISAVHCALRARHNAPR